MTSSVLDFGPVFYLTTYPLQAEKWALRKAGRLDSLPIVSVYELNEDCSAFVLLSEAKHLPLLQGRFFTQFRMTIAKKSNSEL